MHTASGAEWSPGQCVPPRGRDGAKRTGVHTGVVAIVGRPSVLHTSVTWPVLNPLCVEVVFDIVRQLAHNPNRIEPRHKIFDSQPPGNPGRAGPPDRHQAFKRRRRAFSDHVFVVLEMQHRLAIRTPFVSELAHALHHST